MNLDLELMKAMKQTEHIDWSILMTDNPEVTTELIELQPLTDDNPLKSKRFWSMIIGAVVMLLATWFPELRTHADEIIPAVLIIVGLLVGGYSVEDAVRAYKA